VIGSAKAGRTRKNDLIVVPAGSFAMGSPAGQGIDDEHPQHNVTIGKPFAAAKFERTFAEWDACVADGGCNCYKRTTTATSYKIR
jgi:formylglycine-generating enzyme required for sulfatase activity